MRKGKVEERKGRGKEKREKGSEGRKVLTSPQIRKAHPWLNALSKSQPKVSTGWRWAFFIVAKTEVDVEGPSPSCGAVCEGSSNDGSDNSSQTPKYRH